jgi:uncharacterized protein (TIGR03435 family)
MSNFALFLSPVGVESVVRWSVVPGPPKRTSRQPNRRVRHMRLATLASLTLITIATAGVSTQAPAQATGPTFDVVSIKRNTTNTMGSTGSQERIDGSFTLINIPIGTLIGRAYGSAPIDMVGLPAWAMSERYDVSTTSPLQKATPDERAGMIRAMLLDRFKLGAHTENREQPVYDLILARSDRRLGANMKPSEVDCVAKNAADRAAAEASRSGQPPPPQGVFDFNAPAPLCSLRFNGDRLEGDLTMDTLARMLRSAAGRPIIDKTGLSGSYRMELTFDRMAGLRGPASDPSTNTAPSVFVAVQEQLGIEAGIIARRARDAHHRPPRTSI